MSSSGSSRRLAAVALAAAGTLALSGLPTRARAQPPAGSQEPADVSRESEMAERAELFVALLKRRAQRILDARRPPPPPFLELFAGGTGGHESNVNLDGSRKGDYFTEESFSVVLHPQVNRWLSGELSWDQSHTWFTEFTDSNLHSNTLTAVAQMKPHRRLQVEAGTEYGVLHFPRDEDSTFTDRRVLANVVVAHLPWLSHKVGWIFQDREYDTRLARDPDLNRLAGLVREDRRHTGVYEIRLRFPKSFARLGVEYYENLSNDHYQDFYDYSDVRLRALFVRIFSPQWIGTLSASHERKNYHERSVPVIAVAERDNLLTVAASLIYQINAHWKVTGSLTYRHQDSNDPRLDFSDWIRQVGVSVSF